MVGTRFWMAYLPWQAKCASRLRGYELWYICKPNWYHYTSVDNAKSIATTGTYIAGTKGNDGYGMYLTNYDHETGYQGYQLSQ